MSDRDPREITDYERIQYYERRVLQLEQAIADLRAASSQKEPMTIDKLKEELRRRRSQTHRAYHEAKHHDEVEAQQQSGRCYAYSIALQLVNQLEITKAELLCDCSCHSCAEGEHCGGIYWKGDPRFDDKAEPISICQKGPDWDKGVVRSKLRPQVGDVLLMAEFAPLTPGWWEITKVYDHCYGPDQRWQSHQAFRVRCIWTMGSFSYGATTVINECDVRAYILRHFRQIEGETTNGS